MRCEACHGLGFKLKREKFGDMKWVRVSETPCPECNGSGVAHCCEGLICNEPIPQEITQKVTDMGKEEHID
jgi:DnaJ-class molecular chaperone